MTEKELRKKVVDIMVGWLGCKESDGSHKKIIDIYNSHKPLARGYKLKYTDSWCAGTVSAVFIKAGLTDIFPLEVGCPKMIEKAKKMKIWVEDDSYVPSIGDAILYDWEDSGKGDNIGNPDHVGLVVSVSKGAIKVIEGNKHDEVAYRTIQVDGKYIRGFVTPNFKAKASKSTSNKPVKQTSKFVQVTAKSGLNVRKGPSTSYDKVKALVYGTTVEITEEKSGWGKIKGGWICLKYTKKV